MTDQQVTPSVSVKSTLDVIFSAGFVVMGDSRDFSTDSIQVHLARGPERITWSFPMKKAVASIHDVEGATSVLSLPVRELSFDVPMRG